MNKAIREQIPENLLFRYRIPCRKVESKSKARTPKPVDLDESYRLPHFGEFESQYQFADMRIGWGEKGVYITLIVKGRQLPLECRETAILDSDSLYVWLDTRDTHDVHRATRFCHWFVLLPAGAGAKKNKPVANPVKINRAREVSPAFNRAKIGIESEVTKTGYKINALIPAASLNGWDPNEHHNLGFNFMVNDSELGYQTLALGPDMPIEEDPSLWHTLHLVD
jgi:hypothetical protein